MRGQSQWNTQTYVILILKFQEFAWDVWDLVMQKMVNILGL